MYKGKGTFTMLRIQYYDIHKQFRQRLILKQANFSLQTGTSTLLTGKNGTGKSTLLRILAGLEKPQMFNADIGSGLLKWRTYRKLVSHNLMYLHQQPYLFDKDVFYNLDYALDRTLHQSERKKKVQHALEWSGLKHLASTHAKSVSGGEAQQIALVRAWLHKPKIMLLDEPTANMDSNARARTITLLKQLREKGVGLVISSHDPNFFINEVDQHIHLENNELHIISACKQNH